MNLLFLGIEKSGSFGNTKGRLIVLVWRIAADLNWWIFVDPADRDS